MFLNLTYIIMKTIIIILSVIIFLQFVGCSNNDNIQMVRMDDNQLAIYKDGFIYIIHSPNENNIRQRRIEIENFNK